MSHPQQREFINTVRCKFPGFFYGTTVLEVGSLNINGTLRDFFTDCTYTGIDVAEGLCVDIVCQGQHFRSPEPFDVVISAEMMEHNPFWAETFENMVALTRSGGLLAFTCAGRDRPEHGTTRSAPETSPLTVGLEWDYYGNVLPEDFDRFPMGEWFTDWAITENLASCDTYGYGIRR